MPMNVSKKAFTLVELIVVITILAILWTVAFVSLQEYTTFARNAIRLDGISKVAKLVETKKQVWIDALSFVEPGQEVPSAEIWWATVNPWVDYQAGIINISALELKSEDFSDPTNGRLFSMWATIKKWGQYEIASTIEDSWSERAILSGNYEARDTQVLTWTGLLSEDIFVLSDPRDINKLSKWDVIIWTGVTPNTRILKVSNDGLTITLSNNFSADSNAIQLASSETSGMIVSVDGVTPVTEWSSNVAYRVTSSEPPAFLGNSPDSFVTVWQTWNIWGVANRVLINLRPGSVNNFTVDWGDGTSDLITSFAQPERIHTYENSWIYTVIIDWTVTNFRPWGSPSAPYLLDIQQWWNVVLDNNGGQFEGVSNMIVSATDNLDISNITTMQRMFYWASSFNQDIWDWDTSNVENMLGMFSYATSFNQDIWDWNTSNVKDMAAMFAQDNSFNQDIWDWDTSNVENMWWMFQNNTTFNQDIWDWDTSKVQFMANMFSWTTWFDQDIWDWETGEVTNMRGMFIRASSFNQDIWDWDTSKVEEMRNMFYDTSSFNQDIWDWETGLVGDMRNMFRGASSFDQNISGWDVSSVGSNYGGFDFSTPASWINDEKPIFSP